MRRMMTIEKRCRLLRQLYLLHKEGFTFNYDICNEYKISHEFFKACIDLGVVKKIEKNKFDWMVGEPSRILCEQISEKEVARIAKRKEDMKTAADVVEEPHEPELPLEESNQYNAWEHLTTDELKSILKNTANELRRREFDVVLQLKQTVIYIL